MTDYQESPDLLPLLPETPQRIGRPVIAWVVITVLVVIAAGIRHIRPFTADPSRDDQASLLVMRMQAQYLVGAARTVGKEDPGLYYAQAKALNTGSVGQRLRFVIVAGELAGAKEALAQLQKLDEKLAEQAIKPSASQATVRDILGRLYDDYVEGDFDASSLRQEEHELLSERLGWFGELALAPPETLDQEAREAVLWPAQRTMWVLFGSIAALLVLGFAGFAGLVTFLILAALRKLRGGIRPGVPHGGVYAETFAVWMALYMGLSLAGSWLPIRASPFLVSGIAMLLSLGAMAWPVVRGVPWQQVRREIGLTAGRQPMLEPLVGFGGYAMAIPLLVLGMIVTFLLLTAQKAALGGGAEDQFHTGEGLQAHPILALMASPSWWERLQALVMVSVVAPVVEEIMFRGVLYRHLREASARLGFVWSFLASAVLVSFIFAVIHPQGVLAVPGLAALALAFTLVREWRGTLVPGMVAHALNNGVLMLLVILTLG